MLCFEQTSPAAPQAVWRLLAEPARWSSWAPHIRGAIGLGSPEVQKGRRGVVLVAFLAPVPVRVADKDPGRSWDWQTGPVSIRHAVEARENGSRVRIEIDAPAPLERVIALAYGPLITWVLRRLSRIAAAAGVPA